MRNLILLTVCFILLAGKYELDLAGYYKMETPYGYSQELILMSNGSFLYTHKGHIWGENNTHGNWSIKLDTLHLRIEEKFRDTKALFENRVIQSQCNNNKSKVSLWIFDEHLNPLDLIIVYINGDKNNALLTNEDGMVGIGSGGNSTVEVLFPGFGIHEFTVLEEACEIFLFSKTRPAMFDEEAIYYKKWVIRENLLFPVLSDGEDNEIYAKKSDL